jgi:hypothetical protein
MIRSFSLRSRVAAASSRASGAAPARRRAVLAVLFARAELGRAFELDDRARVDRLLAADFPREDVVRLLELEREPREPPLLA